MTAEELECGSLALSGPTLASRTRVVPYIPALHCVTVPMPDLVSWQHGLPVLEGDKVLLREVRRSDAATMAADLTTPEVIRYIAKPPDTIEAFTRFIDWSIQERVQGNGASFAALTLTDLAVVGLVTMRTHSAEGGGCNWGFIFASRVWGHGFFADSAKSILRFSHDAMGRHDLEAWCQTGNSRANRALAKLNSAPELRRDIEEPDKPRGDYIRWLTPTDAVRRSHAGWNSYVSDWRT